MERSPKNPLKHPVVAATIGFLVATALWMIVLIGLMVVEPREAAAVERIIDGGYREWMEGSETAQRAACQVVAKRLEPDIDDRKLLLHSRELWANVHYWMTQPGLENLTFRQAAAMIHVIEHPKKQPPQNPDLET